MESNGDHRRVRAELVLVGLAVLVGVTIAAPMVFYMVQGIDIVHGPNWLWVSAYCGSLAAYIATSLLTAAHRPRTMFVSFVVHELLAVVSVLLLREGLGIVAVILVFGAALSCYILPLWATLTVVVVNTLVVGTSAWQGDLLNALISASFYLVIQIVSVITVRTWIGQEKSQRSLAEAHAELAAAAALLEHSAKNEERLRISRDLHDLVGHQLTALTLELEIASHQVTEPAREHVLRARSIAKDLLGDVREAVSHQRDDAGSLAAVLHRATAGITHPNVHLRVDNTITAGSELTTLLVRATQELITNTIRHATGASSLDINIERDELASTSIHRCSFSGTV